MSVLRCFLVAITVWVGNVSAAQAQSMYQGMSYTPWSADVLNSASSDYSIFNMKQIGVDTVALNVWWFQESVTSNLIAEDLNSYSASLDSIRHAIDEIQGRGMRVLLKPNLDVKTGEWRALIDPSDTNTWFQNYGNFIGTFADMAQQKGVEMLSIGTEMNNMENADNDSRWRNLITDVRSRFDGKVTYSANFEPVAGIGGGYQSVNWWDDLDTIGIDTYFPLTNSTNASFSELKASWELHATNIETWRSSRGLTQPVLFTEVGYRSLDGAATAPWGADVSTTVDLQEQADAYRALLSTMQERAWWEGAFWWDWEPDPNAGGPLSTTFTSQNKPAQQVLIDFYGGGQPSPFRAPQLLNSWESGLEGFSYGGFGLEGTSVTSSTIGATEGSQSLAITSPDEGFNWAADLTWFSHNGPDGFNAVRAAAERPDDFLLEFDVTYRVDSIPQGEISFLELWVAFQSERGWMQIGGLAETDGSDDETIRVSIPLEDFELSTLDPQSTWFQLVFGLNNDWGAEQAGTVYIDNLQLVDTAFVLADRDLDGDVDGNDFLAWQRTDGTAAGLSNWETNFGQSLAPSALSTNLVVPEPTTLLLSVSFLLHALLSTSYRAR